MDQYSGNIDALCRYYYDQHDYQSLSNLIRVSKDTHKTCQQYLKRLKPITQSIALDDRLKKFAEKLKLADISEYVDGKDVEIIRQYIYQDLQRKGRYAPTWQEFVVATEMWMERNTLHRDLFIFPIAQVIHDFWEEIKEPVDVDEFIRTRTTYGLNYKKVQKNPKSKKSKNPL